MIIEGGCYCGGVRYRAEGEPIMRAECFCRECQYITGGGNLLMIAMPSAGFEITKGAVKDYKRADLPNGVTRQFCPECGTHLFTRAPGFEIAVIIKLGTLDDLSLYGKADSANFVCDAQPYHRLPDDIPTFPEVDARLGAAGITNSDVARFTPKKTRAAPIGLPNVAALATVMFERADFGERQSITDA